MQNFECILSSFEEIYPIWHDKLWPGRISEIKPTSSLYWEMPTKIIKNSSIFEKHPSTFWAVKDNKKIIGVNSGFDYINKDWETIFTFGYDNMIIAEVLFENVELAPFEIKTIFDLYWWLNFCFGWEDVDSRILFKYAQTPYWQSTFSFFNTEDFQKWSINNHDIKHQGTWKTYKQPAKDFIYKYFKDENYRKNKLKELSLIKVLEGAVDGEYTKEIKDERNESPNSLKLVLENGQFWKRNEKVPDEIYEEILT